MQLQAVLRSLRWCHDDHAGARCLAHRAPLSAPHLAAWRQQRGHLRRPARRVEAAQQQGQAGDASSSSSSPGDGESQMEVEGDYCMPAYVTFDNKANPNFTVLDVEVHDYPGLMRVLAWTLNGLDLLAQNAIVRTTPEGMAKNTFWLSTISGKKLSDSRAELVAERVRDFVTYCSPRSDTAAATEFCVGPVRVSNSEHDAYTVVYVREPRPTPGYLLEVASVMSGLNANIYQGVVQGCTDCGEDVPQLVEGIKREDGRLFKFWVQDRAGGKLDYNHISALIYALGVGLGFQAFPLAPPDQEVLQGASAPATFGL